MNPQHVKTAADAAAGSYVVLHFLGLTLSDWAALAALIYSLAQLALLAWKGWRAYRRNVRAGG